MMTAFKIWTTHRRGEDGRWNRSQWHKRTMNYKQSRS